MVIRLVQYSVRMVIRLVQTEIQVLDQMVIRDVHDVHDVHGTVHIRRRILGRLGPQHLHLNLFAGRSFGF